MKSVKPGRPTRWSRPPRQRRSRQTLSRILGAVEVLLRDGGFPQATVGQIVERAGCSVGSFYARFPGKREALRAFFEVFCRRREALVDRHLDPAVQEDRSLREILEAYIRLEVGAHREHRGLLRAGNLLVGVTEDRWVVRRARRNQEHLAGRMETLLRRRRAEHAHPHPKLASRLVLMQMAGVLDATRLLPAPGWGRPPADRVVTAELTRMVLSYLDIP